MTHGPPVVSDTRSCGRVGWIGVPWVMGSLEKLAVVGAGSVGSAVAYASMIDRVADEIVLYDVDGARARAEALDLSHGVQFVGGGRISGGADIAGCTGADLVIITAGATHGPGATRLDLAGHNVELVRTLLPRLVDVAPDAVYLLLTNPVDVVTFIAQEISGLDPSRVLGSGTVLDTSRLRHLLAQRLDVAVTSVHAMVIGEHGDSELVLWSSASVGGTPLLEVVGPGGGRIERGDLEGLRVEVRDAAATIIAGKGKTNLAIGLATARIAGAISRDEHAVLPVSVRTHVDDVGDVCLSLPSVVGRQGVLSQLPLVLDQSEQVALVRSAATLGDVLDSVARQWTPPLGRRSV